MNGREVPGTSIDGFSSSSPAASSFSLEGQQKGEEWRRRSILEWGVILGLGLHIYMCGIPIQQAGLGDGRRRRTPTVDGQRHDIRSRVCIRVCLVSASWRINKRETNQNIDNNRWLARWDIHSEHLQQLLKSTWYYYYFDKNTKTPLQQLFKFTWYISQLGKHRVRTRISPRAAWTAYRASTAMSHARERSSQCANRKFLGR